MTPKQLLRASRSLVREAQPGTEGLWSRGATVLLRQALEMAVKRRIVAKVANVRATTFRSQFLALHFFVRADVARRAHYLFDALSRATHHQGYELAPTAASLRAWQDELEALLEAL